MLISHQKQPEEDKDVKLTGLTNLQTESMESI